MNSTDLDAGHRDDLKLAAAKMLGAKRRAFQAARALKYCAGNPRRAETVVGWSRQAVELALHEQRTGAVCLSAQSAFAGDKLWKEKHPEATAVLWELAQAHSQQDPTFRTPLSQRVNSIHPVRRFAPPVQFRRNTQPNHRPSSFAHYPAKSGEICFVRFGSK